MTRRIRGLLTFAAGCACGLAAAVAQAAAITWTIDQSASSVSLSVPDTAISLNNLLFTVRVRNQASTSGGNNAWNVGNTSFMAGSINTNYSESSGFIQFLTNAPGTWTAVNSGNYRPNPAAFNSANTNPDNFDGQFQNASLAPAVFGARLRASVSLITADAGYVSFHDMQYDMTSGVLPVTAGTFDASDLVCGISSLLLDFDGLSVPLLGQPINDRVNQSENGIIEQNLVVGPATITNLGGLNRKLTIPVSVTGFIDTGGFPNPMLLPINLTGQVVAYAVVPEPEAVSLALCSAMSVLLRVGWTRRRR